MRRRRGRTRHGLTVVKAARLERTVNREAREALVGILTPRLVEVVDSFRGGVDIGALERGVVQANLGGIDEVLVPEALIGDMSSVIEETYGEAIDSGAHIGLRFSGIAGLEFPADAVTLAAQRWVATDGAAAIKGISGRTRGAINRSIRDALGDSISPAHAANQIGRSVGLTNRDITALNNFEARLIAQRIPNELADNQLVRETIGRDVERHRAKLLRRRGNAIAQTEMQNAIQAGERAFWEAAAEAGEINLQDVIKTWFTVRDSHVCPICEPLHGVKAAFRDSFFSRGWTGLGPSAHPLCRCYLKFQHQEAVVAA